MPVQLDVGVTRKVGEPNFGSRGASVNLKVELDSAVVGEPQRLQQEISRLFGLARQSVDRELQDGGCATALPAQHIQNGHRVNGQQTATPTGSDNGAATGWQRNGRSVRPATASQARAIRAIASRCSVDLDQLLGERFGVAQPEQLSLAAASGLIDELKGQPSAGGNGGRT
jgi:hypothetical protein